jgi:hypothetical protein
MTWPLTKRRYRIGETGKYRNQAAISACIWRNERRNISGEKLCGENDEASKRPDHHRRSASQKKKRLNENSGALQKTATKAASAQRRKKRKRKRNGVLSRSAPAYKTRRHLAAASRRRRRQGVRRRLGVNENARAQRRQTKTANIAAIRGVTARIAACASGICAGAQRHITGQHWLRHQRQDAYLSTPARENQAARKSIEEGESESMAKQRNMHMKIEAYGNV